MELDVFVEACSSRFGNDINKIFRELSRIKFQLTGTVLVVMKLVVDWLCDISIKKKIFEVRCDPVSLSDIAILMRVVGFALLVIFRIRASCTSVPGDGLE